MEVWKSWCKAIREGQTEQWLQRAKCRGVKAPVADTVGRALRRISDVEADPGHVQIGGTVGWLCRMYTTAHREQVVQQSCLALILYVLPQ